MLNIIYRNCLGKTMLKLTAKLVFGERTQTFCSRTLKMFTKILFFVSLGTNTTAPFKPFQGSVALLSVSKMWFFSIKTATWCCSTKLQDFLKMTLS